jgi:hypothetical protein
MKSSLADGLADEVRQNGSKKPRPGTMRFILMGEGKRCLQEQNPNFGRKTNAVFQQVPQDFLQTAAALELHFMY